MVETLAPARFFLDQIHAFQYLQVFGNRRSIEIKFRCDLTCGKRPIAQQLKDSPSYGIGYCTENVVGTPASWNTFASE